MTPDTQFRSLVEALVKEPGVTQSKMFGSPGLKVGGKVFAVLVKGQLVVKLPKDRVAAIVASGEGAFFDLGMGRLMKEWVSVAPANDVDWLRLARDARDFVAASL